MHKGTTLASLARLIVPFTEPAHRPKVILVGRPDYQISRADKKQNFNLIWRMYLYITYIYSPLHTFVI